MSTHTEFKRIWHKIDSVPGWMSPGQEKCLFDLVKSLPNRARVLELGCFLGRSTVAMAFACQHSQRHIYSIDTFKGNDDDFVSGQSDVYWEGNDFLNTFMNHLDRNDLLSYVTPLRGWTTEVAKHWTADVDMLFIDAGHTYEAVLKDVELYYDFVKPGGIVALHDVTPGWPDVQRVWTEKVSPLLLDTGCQGSLAYGFKP